MSSGRIAGLFLSLFLLLAAGCNEKRNRPFEVGILGGIGPKALTIQGFLDGMEESGYTEGNDIAYDIRTPGFRPDVHREILEEFIENDVDLIFVYPTETAYLAKEMTASTGIPIVFAIAFTEGSGLIDSIESPGRDITGIRYPDENIALKRYEIFKALLPDLRNIAVAYDKNEPLPIAQLDLLRSRTKEENINLREFPSEDGEDLARQLYETPEGGRESLDAFLLISDAFNTGSEVISRLADFCSERRIPLGGQFGTKVIGSSLFSVGINFYETGMQAASLADRILSGVPAGELPVRSSDLYISINYTQAEKLELEIPKTILAMADEIVSE